MDFHGHRGRAWLAQGDVDRALSDLNRALTLNPTIAEVWLLRGAAWLAKRDYSRAVADFDEALKLNPRLADAFCNRGVAHIAQGNVKAAEADFARCRALGGTLKPEAERLMEKMKRQSH